MKLCVSLTEDTTAALVARMAELADLADLFEVRADLVRDLDLEAVLRARVKPLLFTCMPESEGGRFPDRDQERRRRLLSEAVERGFDLVDVNARGAFPDVVASKAGRGLVLSWHDLEGTPDDLDSVYDRMAALGPDIVKIAVTARSIADLGRLLALRGAARRGRGAAARRPRDGPARRRLAHPRRALRRAVHVRLGGCRAGGGTRTDPGARRSSTATGYARSAGTRASSASSGRTSCAACLRRSRTAPSPSAGWTRCTCRCRPSRCPPSSTRFRRSASRASA